MFRRIVVPLDGSELAEQALPQAEELARLTAAPMHLVRAVDPTPLLRGTYGLAIESAAVEPLLREEQTAARGYLDRVAREVGARGPSVTTELREGFASRELIDLAQPDDLIVMASHGRGGLARWFMGSVAEEVVRRSRAPVLLVRSDPAQPPAEPPAPSPDAGPPTSPPA